MSIRNAALFALIGMILLTVLVALGFVRDLVSLTRGAVAGIVLVTSAVHLLAALGMTIFLYVFRRAYY